MDAYDRVDEELQKELDELQEQYAQSEITLSELNSRVARAERDARAELRYLDTCWPESVR